MCEGVLDNPASKSGLQKHPWDLFGEKAYYFETGFLQNSCRYHQQWSIFSQGQWKGAYCRIYFLNDGSRFSCAKLERPVDKSLNFSLTFSDRETWSFKNGNKIQNEFNRGLQFFGNKMQIQQLHCDIFGDLKNTNISSDRTVQANVYQKNEEDLNDQNVDVSQSNYGVTGKRQQNRVMEGLGHDASQPQVSLKHGINFCQHTLKNDIKELEKVHGILAYISRKYEIALSRNI